MKAVIYSRPDGGVSIMHPAISVNDPPDMTEDQALGRAMTKLPPDAIGVQIVERDTLPTDRTFRDAWTHDGKVLGVDMAKARAIHMDRIRQARDVDLVRLDALWTRASGRKQQAEADAVEAARERLRNLPQTFDLSVAATAEELAQLWPDIAAIGDERRAIVDVAVAEAAPAIAMAR